MPISYRSSALALVAVTATAHAEPVEVAAGGAYVIFGTPIRETTNAIAVSGSLSVRIDDTFEAGLRGNVTFGDGAIRLLGPHVRQRLAEHVFVGYGLAIAGLTGGDDHTPRATGIGLAADLRAGLRYGNVTLTAEAIPILVFASDSFAAESNLAYALEFGVALGYQR